MAPATARWIVGATLLSHNRRAVAPAISYARSSEVGGWTRRRSATRIFGVQARADRAREAVRTRLERTGGKHALDFHLCFRLAATTGTDFEVADDIAQRTRADATLGRAGDQPNRLVTGHGSCSSARGDRPHGSTGVTPPASGRTRISVSSSGRSRWRARKSRDSTVPRGVLTTSAISSVLEALHVAQDDEHAQFLGQRAERAIDHLTSQQRLLEIVCRRDLVHGVVVACG